MKLKLLIINTLQVDTKWSITWEYCTRYMLPNNILSMSLAFSILDRVSLNKETKKR